MKNKKLLVVSLFGVLALVSCGKTKPSSSVTSSGTTSDVTSDVTSQLSGANGLFNYQASSIAEKEKILYELEKYAVDEYAGGIALFDDGGGTLFNPRVSLPTDVYVPNYGFGVGESTITSPMTLEQEPEANFANYYHTWIAKDPQYANYWDGNDSTSSTLWGMTTSSYYSTEFTEDKTGFRWYSSLATEMPIALNADADGLATRWRVKVKVATTHPEMKYATLSTIPARAAFNGRGVVLEDYLTPFKAMLDNSLFRATDLGSATSGFVGAKEYKEAVAAGKPTDWSTVGIQINVAEQAVDFEFNARKDDFQAMYNLSSTLFSPMPQEFLETIKTVDKPGAKVLGSPNVDDNLSLGTYVIEKWEEAKQIVFKKNNLYFEKDRTFLEGYKYAVIAGGSAVAFEEFLAGKLDSAGIPSAHINTYANDPRRRQSLGATVMKIQTNRTTQERWNELFGPEGSVKPTAAANAYQVKPIMSSKEFIDGLYFATDRQALAVTRGGNPAQAVFSDAYSLDGRTGASWRATELGKKVLEDRSPETNGYSLELAKTLFVEATDKLVADGKYVRGTAAAPTVISLTMEFYFQAFITQFGAILEGQWENAFNSAVEGFKLDIVTTYPSDPNEAYDRMGAGQFDLSYGAIQGSTLDPLGFMEVFSTTNKTGLTLSWGQYDTRVLSEETPLTYDDKLWAFDTLNSAANTGVVAEDGEEAILLKMTGISAEREAGSADYYTVTMTGTYYKDAPEAISYSLEYVEVWYSDNSKTVIAAGTEGLTLTLVDGVWTVSLRHNVYDPDYTDLTVFLLINFQGSLSKASFYLPFTLADAA